MFHLVITIVCIEEPSRENFYHIETSQLIFFANRLTGLCIVSVFCRFLLVFVGIFVHSMLLLF